MWRRIKDDFASDWELKVLQSFVSIFGVCLIASSSCWFHGMGGKVFVGNSSSGVQVALYLEHPFPISQQIPNNSLIPMGVVLLPCW